MALRPYHVVYGGTSHYIEAPSPAAAIAEAVGEDASAKPMTGSAVARFVRAGGEFKIAGDKPRADGENRAAQLFETEQPDGGEGQQQQESETDEKE